MTNFSLQLSDKYLKSKDINFNTSNIIIPLSQLGCLEIKGKNSYAFLQNILTNDVNSLNINQSQPNGICNSKGRLLATFILISHKRDSLQIVLPKNMCNIVQQRLNMYKLRSKVTISNIGNELSIVGLAPRSKIFNKYIKFPQKNYQVCKYHNRIFIKIPGLINRYLYIDYQDSIHNLYKRLLIQGWKMSSEIEWQLIDIDIGLATILTSTKEKFTPQQINFDLIGGISFNKGCYPGQEIVARLHYLGKPSRRLFSAQAVIKILPKAGENIKDNHGNILGHVVAGQYNLNNAVKLLLSLKLADYNKDMFINESTIVTNIKLLNP